MWTLQTIFLMHELRNGTTASSGMRHIASSCTSYMHVYLATHGCQYSLVGPRRAPDPLAKEQERLQETHTYRARWAAWTPGPIILSSDCPCSLGTRPTTHWKVVQPRRYAVPQSEMPKPDQPDQRHCLCYGSTFSVSPYLIARKLAWGGDHKYAVKRERTKWCERSDWPPLLTFALYKCMHTMCFI